MANSVRFLILIIIIIIIIIILLIIIQYRKRNNTKVQCKTTFKVILDYGWK